MTKVEDRFKRQTMKRSSTVGKKSISPKPKSQNEDVIEVDTHGPTKGNFIFHLNNDSLSTLYEAAKIILGPNSSTTSTSTSTTITPSTSKAVTSPTSSSAHSPVSSPTTSKASYVTPPSSPLVTVFQPEEGKNALKNMIGTLSFPVSQTPASKQQNTSFIMTHIRPPHKKTHKCSYCTASFRRKEHLKRHVMIHTGERPFQCNLCTKSFSREDNLTQHLRTHEKKNDFISQMDSNLEPSRLSP